MTLASRFTELKKKIGGNREFYEREMFLGTPMEQLQSITMPNSYNKRIIAELDFAISLSEVAGGKYDEIVSEALGFLENAMENDGVLTNAMCNSAESILMPMKDAAKEYKLILAGHAHLDMNWMWSWHETVAITLATFKTVLNLMDMYPEFCFSQSQASVYKIVEDFEPEMMKKIRKRIDEGRWEVTASSWVETDKNMPDTESLIKHIKYTKEYLRDSWGIDPSSLEIDFSPDTFGHSAQIPEIDIAGGVKYCYHCRGKDAEDSLYRWRSTSGSELLCCCESRWYNSGITQEIGTGIFEMLKRSYGLKTALIVYGIGDHGGGPTRNDIENALEMMEWPVFPSIKFGTFREYFHEAESVREQLPVVYGEHNFIFMGCYTTQSRIKQANRRCERELTESETLSSFVPEKSQSGTDNKMFTKAWRDVLFTHFHDILTGSCTQASRECAMGLLSNSYAIANTRNTSALSALSGAIDNSKVKADCILKNFSEGAGTGYNLSDFSGIPITERGSGKTRIINVFNPIGVEKKEVVEITLWDWQGDLRYVTVNDVDGNPIEFCVKDTKKINYWAHKFFKLYVYLTLPAFGYTTIVVGEAEIEHYQHYLETTVRHDDEYSNIVLENEHVRAEFDALSGRLISYRDCNGEEYIKQGESGGFNFIDLQNEGMSSWRIGKYLAVKPLVSPIKISDVQKNALCSKFNVEYQFGESKLSAEIGLDKGSRNVRIKSEVFWYERGGDTIPLLNYSVPLKSTPEKYLYDIPAGVIERKPLNNDVPALKFAAAPFENGKSFVIVTDCKYGFRGTAEGLLSSTLINGANDPDPLPESGNHTFTFNLGVEATNPKALIENALNLNAKAVYVPASSHGGELPASGSFLGFESSCAVISSVTRSTDGKDFVIRIFNTACQNGKATLKFNKDVVSAEAVDYFENPAEGKVAANGAIVTAELIPCGIMTIKIKLA